jgi:AcrR family transcriptional regulator
MPSSPSKSGQTRRRILDAAVDLFRERGFGETTMRDIAQEAGVATGLAYYYFCAKEDIVLAFYRQAMADMEPLLDEVFDHHRKFDVRLRALIEVKLRYFAPNRRFLGALLGYSADVENPLSPFSPATEEIRSADTAYFARALGESAMKVPEDLRAALPGMLWLYQMGLIFFWLFDRSPQARATHKLVEKSVHILVLLIRLSGLPLMRPARKLVLEIAQLVEEGSRA